MSEKYNTKILPVYETDLKETDPEFIEFEQRIEGKARKNG